MPTIFCVDDQHYLAEMGRRCGHAKYPQVIRPFCVAVLCLTLRYRYRITNLPLVPSLMHQMVNHPDFTRTDFSSLKSVTTGAAYTPPELFETFKKYVKNVANIYEGYGVSEMVRILHVSLSPSVLTY